MDAKISALEKEHELLQRKREAIREHMSGVFNKIQELRKKRDEMSDKLTKEEEVEFRRALTVVGELLEREDNLFGGLRIEDEEPDKDIDTGYFGDSGPKKYSIDVRTNYVRCVCPGLRVDVTIKTKSAAIKRIIREMIESSEYVREEDKLEERTYWGIDWDYHDHITVKNKMSSEEYYKNDKY
jgi:hypothetical protein